MSPGWRQVRNWSLRLAAVALLAGTGFGIYTFRRAHAGQEFPNAQVKKGDFLVLVRCRGSLKARRSVGIYTPTVPNLRIAWLSPIGERVQAGDPIVRFDSSTARQQLMQKEAQLKQAQATLDQAIAQSRITAQQDQTELASAKFSLQQAEFQAKQQEIVSRIKGDESRIDLGIAQQRVKVQDATVALHDASDKSRIASLTRQRDQVQTDVDLTRSRIAEMELKAPIAGIVMFRMNYSGVITTADAKPYKVGDNVGSNMLLGEIPDLNTLEMDVKLEEADRGRVGLNQDVLVRVDALPELTIPAKVSQVTALAEMSISEYPYTRSFRASAALLRPDARLRPDMNGGLDIVIHRIPNAISIPSKALFTSAGNPVVYINEGGSYRAVRVEVLARNPDEVAISGVPAGAEVALVDVSREERKK